MRHLLALAALAAAVTVPVHAQPAVEAPLGRALNGVVQRDGLIDYVRLARQSDALAAALAAIAATDPASLRTDAQKTAFLLNAYNARVLRLVLDHPRAMHLERGDLFGQFFQTRVPVAGLSLTLNELEHGILRRQDRVDERTLPAAARALRPSRLDPRLHVGLNCAAVSCPPLRPTPFTAATVDAELDRAYRAFVASDRAVRLDGRRLVLSSLFDWFGTDFEGGGQSLGDALLRAMPRSRAATFRSRLAGKSARALKADRSVRFAYDWTVNRAR